MLQFKEQVKYFEKNVPGLTQMGMQYMALGSADDLKKQIVELSKRVEELTAKPGEDA